MRHRIVRNLGVFSVHITRLASQELAENALRVRERKLTDTATSTIDVILQAAGLTVIDVLVAGSTVLRFSCALSVVLM